MTLEMLKKPRGKKTVDLEAQDLEEIEVLQQILVELRQLNGTVKTLVERLGRPAGGDGTIASRGDDELEDYE